MILSKTYYLESKLDRIEFFERIKERTVGHTSGSERVYFRGNVDELKGEFKILPIFDVNLRNQIRPLVFGNIVSNTPEGLKVKVRFNLPSEIKAMLIIALVFNLSFLATLPFINLPKDFSREFVYMAFVCAGSIFLMFLVLTFKSKTKDSLDLLLNFTKSRLLTVALHNTQ